MKVFLKKSQLDYFRKKARSSPNEQLAFLVGKETTDGVKISSLEYPELELSTPGNVKSTDESYTELYGKASKRGLTIVGDIHSHPLYPPVMSPDDFSGMLSGGFSVSGIVEVTSDRKTRVVFWSAHSALPCDISYL